MTGTIIALRQKGKAHSSLANLDLIAAELLSARHAGTLLAARITALLDKLERQRDDMFAVTGDLAVLGLTGNDQIDALNGELGIIARDAVLLIDPLIEQIKTFRATAVPSESDGAGTATGR